MNIITAGILAILLTGSLPLQASNETPTHLIIGLDLSNSSPALKPAIIESAARKLNDKIRSMTYHDRIILRTFGEYNFDKNILSEDIIISLRKRPHVATKDIANTMRNILKRLKDERIKIHQETHIIAFIDSITDSYPCHAKTSIVLISDGLEFSDFGNGYTRAANYKDSIKKGKLQDCQITFLGFGRERSIQSHKDLISLRQWWENYAAYTEASLTFITDL